MTRAARILGLLTIFWATQASGFDVEGYSPGMPVPANLQKECAYVKNVDSGVPGYRCNSSLEGKTALLKLAVFEGKIVGVILVSRTYMRPMLKAFTEKYGTPGKPNLRKEEYRWSRDGMSLVMRDIWLGQRVWGYTVVLVDSALFAQASKASPSREGEMSRAGASQRKR